MLLGDEAFIDQVSALAGVMVESLRGGGKIVLCGNGGSASDALHFAGEMVGRFQMERDPWPAVVLNADVTTMTAVANDYGYDDVFARQAKGHLCKGDVFIGISTSGNSENILRAARAAEEKNAVTAALLGRDGGRINGSVHYPVIVPSAVTARIQECHIMIIHILCELVERELAKDE